MEPRTSSDPGGAEVVQIGVGRHMMEDHNNVNGARIGQQV